MRASGTAHRERFARGVVLIVDRILAEIEQASSRDELHDRLLQLHPLLDVDAMADRLREALAPGDLIGRDEGPGGPQ